MFELTIQRTFNAAHAIIMAGVMEKLHTHDWQIKITIAGNQLDDDGLLCDFHAIESHLNTIIEPFENRTFNQIPPFDQINPTAENIAMYLSDQMMQLVQTHTNNRASVTAVHITESPGCVATYRTTITS